MLAPPGPKVMDRLSREMGMRRDHQVRLHSNQTDWKLDLPPNIALPDGEEVPYGSSTRLQIRDSEQVRALDRRRVSACARVRACGRNVKRVHIPMKFRMYYWGPDLKIA